MDRVDGAVHRQELTPVHFLSRAGLVHADRPAVTDGEAAYTWSELSSRARRFARALRRAGVEKGDRVAFLALNGEPLFLAHFAVPMAGGVLVAINTRLARAEVDYILKQSGSKLLFYSPELEAQLPDLPEGARSLSIRQDLEDLMADEDDAPLTTSPIHEDEIIAINYTSGTTGRPKGVMYHHRGAYLNALAMALEHKLTTDSVYLWTLPMFHCNGWTFPWALAAVGARSICIPQIVPDEVWPLFEGEVTHLCAAPTVLGLLANHPRAHRLERKVRIFTAGAPPSPTLIEQMTDLNFELDHVYGLTETYGPFTMLVPPWGGEALSAEDRARVVARQGLPNVCAGEVRVVDDDMHDVPADGTTMGEVVMRGNVVMTGYFDVPEATAEAFRGGWFHSGDLAVRHPDSSIELRDRKKDIIISGGENISTIEVEQAVASHPAVLECAVIAVPDDKWGEVPKAFVTLKDGVSATEAELIEHCRTRLARFKAPKTVELGPLPKTSTGKVQKFVLRDREWSGMEKRIN